jgi:hypothetical protein
MSIQELSVEQFAQLFHHYYDALAPDFTGANPSHAASWSELPAEERHHMTAAVRLALLELSSANAERSERRRYFAKPGEAEWGC